MKHKSALKSKWAEKIQQLDPQVLCDFAEESGNFLFYWFGDPTEEILLDLKDSIPQIDDLVHFEKVLQRLNELDSLDRTIIGINIKDFFPELIKLHDTCIKRIHSLPRGLYKAEYVLKSIAKRAGADADIEAALYFVSRGHKDVIDIGTLKDSWYAAICGDIVRGRFMQKVPASLKERARSQTISLAEAAKVHISDGFSSRFFSFLDQEEDFVDASMFRAVEWFGITGFEPWLHSLISELSAGPQYGIDHAPASWWLFYWCRSDLALKMVEKRGLEAWLWGLIHGPLDSNNPWKLLSSTRQGERVRDYLILAGIILFAWHRIKPRDMKQDILERASDILLQTQMRSGAWPLYADSSKPDLLATCFAIHGLSLHRPRDWSQVASRAADWLEKQQQPNGFWHVGGGPTVMLTVLVLDSIELARSGSQVTFRLEDDVQGEPKIVHTDATEIPVYTYTDEPWFEPALPLMISKDNDQAHAIVKPSLAIVVATETEIRQVLRTLRPVKRRRRVWKTMKDHDTYYLGQFGSFEAVVMLSSAGSGGISGSTLSVESMIREWDPKAVILLGIAFGANRNKQLPADVLICEHLIPYEFQRLGKEPIFRNPIPVSSSILLNRFRNALDWVFYRPDGTSCSAHFGAFLSGEKLIDNADFKQKLLDQFPNAIGGEMEGAGLCAAATREKKEWMIIKGVCDWADGRKNDEYQAMAAASATSLCHHVFLDEHALDGT